MIVTIEGKITQLMPTSVVIENSKIGYEVYVPTSNLESLKIGQTIKLYILEYIREDKHELYGFNRFEPRQLFEQLISVSGIGPKLALSIISSLGVEKVSNAIAAGKADVLESVSGVGKKTALRLVIELKNRVIGEAKSAPDMANEEVAIDALRRLGYPYKIAKDVVSRLPSNLKTDEERIKEALKVISNK